MMMEHEQIILETRKGCVFFLSRKSGCLFKVEISHRIVGMRYEKPFQFVKFGDINDRELWFN